ncbi:adenosylmethionine decarboxylase [Halteromyces radiatus]|uniref:adenosylmethionine decarboxylase n=1 Tax=Halteromyces radiatus TaxID=101107 RepID=UPI00221E4E31|nr:adenosylmethionine decarboxylase [Halteromyces radiatus]KAI8078873.1 adenosylmethionine decarboxylase [Halteromyces radiatus]
MVAALTINHDDTTLNACMAGENYSAQEGAFEGPEKLLELWFSPSLTDMMDHQHVDSPRGLLAVPRAVWEDMLALVKCTVLNVIQHDHVDAYLLSESSMFVYPHKMIIKTCGTTTLLLALPRMLEIAKTFCYFDKVWRVFYSRKAFMFPDRQTGPHKSWESEVTFLNQFFEDGSAYKIGKMAGDHWHLYTTKPADDVLLHQRTSSHVQGELLECAYQSGESTPVESTFENSSSVPSDQTIEILMTQLNPKNMERFYQQQGMPVGIQGGKLVDEMTGIDQLYPSADVDSYLFEPCGYSSNGLWQDRYFTIHVTPEPQCSYASFETNIPVMESHPSCKDDPIDQLVKQVIHIFDPASFTVTFFTSHNMNQHKRMIHSMSQKQGYKRTDRILYEFDGYDLVYGHYVKLDK